MVFLDADKAVIRHFYEKGYSAYRIWKENPDKKWDKSFVSRLIKRYVADGTMERIKGMVSAALTWHGVSKPIFVNRNGLNVNAKSYRDHLKKELFPAIRKIYPREDWNFNPRWSHFPYKQFSAKFS